MRAARNSSAMPRNRSVQRALVEVLPFRIVAVRGSAPRAARHAAQAELHGERNPDRPSAHDHDLMFWSSPRAASIDLCADRPGDRFPVPRLAAMKRAKSSGVPGAASRRARNDGARVGGLQPLIDRRVEPADDVVRRSGRRNDSVNVITRSPGRRLRSWSARPGPGVRVRLVTASARACPRAQRQHHPDVSDGQLDRAVSTAVASSPPLR